MSFYKPLFRLDNQLTADFNNINLNPKSLHYIMYINDYL